MNYQRETSHTSFSIGVFAILAVFAGLGLIHALSSRIVEHAIGVALIILASGVVIAISGIVACAVIWIRDHRQVKYRNPDYTSVLRREDIEAIADHSEAGSLYLPVYSAATGEVLYYRRASYRAEIQRRDVSS